MLIYDDILRIGNCQISVRNFPVSYKFKTVTELYNIVLFVFSKAILNLLYFFSFVSGLPCFYLKKIVCRSEREITYISYKIELNAHLILFYFHFKGHLSSPAHSGKLEKLTSIHNRKQFFFVLL